MAHRWLMVISMHQPLLATRKLYWLTSKSIIVTQMVQFTGSLTAAKRHCSVRIHGQKQTDMPDQTIYLFILIIHSFEGIFFCD